MSKMQPECRFWTIQPLEVWQTLQRCTEVRVDTSRYHHQCVPERYHWLAAQLRLRRPGYSGLLPWWAYCKSPTCAPIATRPADATGSKCGWNWSSVRSR